MAPSRLRDLMEEMLNLDSWMNGAPQSNITSGQRVKHLVS